MAPSKEMQLPTSFIFFHFVKILTKQVKLVQRKLKALKMSFKTAKVSVSFNKSKLMWKRLKMRSKELTTELINTTNQTYFVSLQMGWRQMQKAHNYDIKLWQLSLCTWIINTSTGGPVVSGCRTESKQVDWMRAYVACEKARETFFYQPTTHVITTFSSFSTYVENIITQPWQKRR